MGLGFTPGPFCSAHRRSYTVNHVHHIVPKSRGGTENPENLVVLDFIEHARIHAEDFLRGGPWFDFRHSGWPFLEDDLRSKVLQKASSEALNIKGFGGDVSTFEQKSKAGKKGDRKSVV